MRAAAALTATRPEWVVSDGLTPYAEALAAMEARAAAIRAGEAEELVWLVEHPPTYTAGTSATRNSGRGTPWAARPTVAPAPLIGYRPRLARVCGRGGMVDAPA